MKIFYPQRSRQDNIIFRPPIWPLRKYPTSVDTEMRYALWRYSKKEQGSHRVSTGKFPRMIIWKTTLYGNYHLHHLYFYLSKLCTCFPMKTASNSYIYKYASAGRTTYFIFICCYQHDSPSAPNLGLPQLLRELSWLVWGCCHLYGEIC